jgi:hypothetical protein
MRKILASGAVLFMMVAAFVIPSGKAKAISTNELGNYLILDQLFGNSYYPMYYTYPGTQTYAYPSYYYPTYYQNYGYNNLGNLLILDQLFNNGGGLFR